jgi:hypothetical protein
MSAKRCAVGLALIAVCVAVGLVVQALAAPPVGPVLVKIPDLVVKQVTVERIGGGEFPAHTFKIIIKNRGVGNAVASTLGVLSLDNVTAGPTGAGVFAAVPTPAIPAGAQVTVQFERQMPIDKAYWVFVADAPVGGKPLGAVTESVGSTRGKCNNSFVVGYSTAYGNPQTFTNPAAM